MILTYDDLGVPTPSHRVFITLPRLISGPDMMSDHWTHMLLSGGSLSAKLWGKPATSSFFLARYSGSPRGKKKKKNNSCHIPHLLQKRRYQSPAETQLTVNVIPWHGRSQNTSETNGDISGVILKTQAESQPPLLNPIARHCLCKNSF